ncbi:MAG TPA: hypothetical protein VI168_10325 [Croceibacterium sp.]
MSSIVSFMARVLLAQGTDLLPPHRHEWGAAMHAEFEHIAAPRSAFAFATGCFWASILERNAAMTTVQKSMQTLAILALAGLAGVTAVARPPHAPTAALFGLLALVYAGTAVLTYLRGSDALLRAASIMLGLSATAYLALIAGDLGLANAELYRALAAECMAIWAVLLGVGTAMRHGRFERPGTI